MDNRKNNGGARKGSGRPKKFINPDNINFRIEKDDKLSLQRIFGKSLNDKFLIWAKKEIQNE